MTVLGRRGFAISVQQIGRSDPQPPAPAGDIARRPGGSEAIRSLVVLEELPCAGEERLADLIGVQYP
ncbi:hypothetical protein GCM10027176_32220 [Actinoallomurus bryophytorum]